MKYYAVTNDPNELMHYGRLGMKWGQHIFGGQKSAAYKRASHKLSRSMRNGISSKKSFWKRNLSPSVLRAKAKAKAAKQEAKAFKKEQKFMNKAIQKAREGKLKYGKLTDDQVRRVTERLALERNARQLGSTEKPRFRTRMKDAIQEGLLQGATRGGAAYIEEQWRGKGKLASQRKYGMKIARAEARAQIKKNRAIEKAELKAARKDAWKQAKLEQDKAFYKEKAESGDRRSLMEIGNNPMAARKRRQAVARNAKKREERALNKEVYKKYLMGGKNDTAESMIGRINDTATREKLLGSSGKRNASTSKRSTSNKLPGFKLRLKDLKKSNGESANKRVNQWHAAQGSASYQILRGADITTKSGKRKSTNRPYVRVRRNTNNPLKG